MLFFMVTGETPSLRPVQSAIDEELFSQIGQGDMDALETLYNSTERTIYAYVLSRLKNPDNTLDVVQDTFLKIRASAHLYKPMGKPLAWMFTIARNLCMDLFRKESRIQTQDTEVLENHPDFSYVTDPTDNMILKAALNILKEEERQSVLLFAVSGLKHREIAESVGVPLSTQLSRYNRAIKKLQGYLIQQEAV